MGQNDGLAMDRPMDEPKLKMARKKKGGGSGPPPGKVKNPGRVRAKKARCFLALQPTKKTTKKVFLVFSCTITENVPKNSQNIVVGT